VKEPFDHARARAFVRAIMDGTGMTVWTGQAKAAMRDHDMTTGSAANVLRGGKITARRLVGETWRYESVTSRMGVEFEFRGHDADPDKVAPNEVAVFDVWRIKS
jgi:hypothetical protein